MTVRRRLPPALLALVLGLTSALAVACGESKDDKKLIASSRAETIKELLDKLAERVDDGRCDELPFRSLHEEIDGLPATTDKRLARRLRDGLAHLESIAPDECDEHKPETTETTETLPPETTETIPEDTTPATTETVPPETTTQPPQTTTQPPTQTEPPADDGTSGGSQAPESGFVPPGQEKKGGKS